MPVRISVSNWDASVFNVWVATIILSEKLQVPTEIVSYVGDDVQFYDDTGGREFANRPPYNWPAVERGGADFTCAGFLGQANNSDDECTHAMLELWSGQDTSKLEYIQQNRTVEYGGFLSTIGRLGWYTNVALLEQAPELASFRGLRDSASTASRFPRPLRFSEACTHTPTPLCAAFEAEFLSSPGNETWAAAGLVGEELFGRFHVGALPAVRVGATSAAAALAARLGLTSAAALPSPLFAGDFAAEVDASGTPAGHLLSPPCTWSAADTQIVSALGLRLRVRRYDTLEYEQILEASAATNHSVLFWWWQVRSPAISNDLDRSRTIYSDLER